MKKIFLTLAIGFMLIFTACDKTAEDNLMNDGVKQSEAAPEASMPDEEFSEEVEDIDEDLANPEEAEVRKYCVWEVSSVNCPVGKVPKFKKGDKICYRCDEYGCTADRGIIIISDGGRNFGDGCRTYGKTTDTNCLVRNDCAGKYVR